MRVVSLVPSWTETLIEAGVDVVGRTRFCIHPAEAVRHIPVVGGTKDWNLPVIQALSPDLLLLDQEENPKWMSELGGGLKWHASHVESVSQMPTELDRLARALGGQTALQEMAVRWQRVLVDPGASCVGADFPGVVEWGRPIGSTSVRRVLYLIWRKPWMAVSADTFIGSVLRRQGIELPKFPEKYPKIEWSEWDTADTLLLFSSEPYPFVRKKSELEVQHSPYAFVDGEKFSWFGVRTLRFLEERT